MKLLIGLVVGCIEKSLIEQRTIVSSTPVVSRLLIKLFENIRLDIEHVYYIYNPSKYNQTIDFKEE